MAYPFGKHEINPSQRFNTRSFKQLFEPVQDILPNLTPLESKGNRPLQLDFEHHVKALVYFHLEEFTSGRHLIQNIQEDDFASSFIAPPDGIKKSSFSEANNTRGLDQFTELFQMLYVKTGKMIPKEYAELGNLVAIDGSFIDAVLSMHWADYKKNTNIPPMTVPHFLIFLTSVFTFPMSTKNIIVTQTIYTLFDKIRGCTKKINYAELFLADFF